MKEFLYLFVGGAGSSAALSAPADRRRREKWFVWIGEMHEAGIYRGGSSLQAGGRTIDGTDRLITAGSLAGAGEVVGGYVLVRVRDIDEAVAHARTCPIYAEGGRVEIRPVMPV